MILITTCALPYLNSRGYIAKRNWLISHIPLKTKYDIARYWGQKLMAFEIYEYFFMAFEIFADVYIM